MQTLILHTMLLKHKAALNQFSKGLNILGLSLSKIGIDAQTFEQFFVHRDGDIWADFIKKLLKGPDTNSDPVVQDAVNMMHKFIYTGNKEDLSDFLLFTTESVIAIGEPRPEYTKVSVEQVQGFFP